MKRGFGTNAPASLRQIAWRRSARFRAMGRAACLRFNALRRAGPKCEATKRSDGQPCQNPPLANGSGRCRLHGGATPSGKKWHVVQYPSSDTPVRAAKSDRKANDQVRRARKLAKRLGAMTPEQRARYDAWQRTHQPGPPGARSAARYAADQNRAIREILERPDAPDALDPEMAELDGLLTELKRQHAAAAEQPADLYLGAIFE
ncbi:HGGxSTG domain-containing protein [Methylobacterium iners]|uniref:Integrase DNA-binding domain-containing protein n=1 Tax=Methylobacterium iners TaxID=418707 RepID=A0ABQ4S238_9HYPH|nr:HGGxSTG domain-containing protein [Methylobacterium iners]GJD96544.1 hypothetical protein OCOJLMKI_3766 [Methylobacterium iners]